MISESKLSKQAELDFMHNFRHDTEGNRWAKHEIESLRRQLNEKSAIITRQLCERDKLRQQVTMLRDAATKARRKLTAYVGICAGDKELTDTIIPMLKEALSTTEPKP